MIWTIKLELHWPHDRFLLGWEFIGADEDYDYRTIKLYLSLCTISYNF